MLIRHSALYVVSKLVPGVLGMATTAILTRLLAPAVYGEYGLALVVMTFGSTLAFDWLGLSYLRFYGMRRGDPAVAATSLVLFGGLVLVTAVLAAAAWTAGAIGPAYLVGLVMMWSYSWFELVSQFEVADFRPGRYMRMNLSRALFICAGAVSAAVLTGSPFWTAVGTAAGTLAGALLGGPRLPPLHRFDRPLARAMTAFGAPLAASLALSAVVTSGLRAMVDWLGSSEALGLYTAGFMLVQNTLAVVAAGIASASYSLAVRKVEAGDQAAIRRQLLDNGTVLLGVLAPAAVGLAITADGAASTLVGARYVHTVAQLTPWMAAGAFFGGIRSHYLDHAFQLGRRPGLQVWVTALAAVVTVGLGMLLIPRLGPVGAAMSLTAAMAVSCVHAVLAGRAAFPLPLPWDAAWRIAVACAVMALAVLALHGGAGPAHFGVQVAIGGLAYGATALALNLLDSQTMLRRALVARRPWAQLR